jgi:serine/threonine protein kinase
MALKALAILSGRRISEKFRLRRTAATGPVQDSRPPGKPANAVDDGAHHRMMQERLGKYTLEQWIGAGGMGEVYRARDNSLGKIVALKMLNKSSLSGDGKARFRQEARAAAALNHPAIVNVFEYAEHEGTDFIVYEYVEGKRLDELILSRALTESTILDIGTQVAEGLAHAHERNVLHRDIKPQNIMVTPDGRAKILDFGLAKKLGVEFVGDSDDTKSESFVRTKEGTIVGTVQYMSPEQISGGTLDGRSDIFSLGVVLYEMVAGTNPFQTDSATSTIARIVSPDTPALPPGTENVSPELQFIIRKCMQKRREDRHPSARMLSEDLKRLKSPRPLSGPVVPDVVLIPRLLSKACMILLQVMYLSIYGVALFYLGDAVNALLGFTTEWITADAMRASEIGRILTTVMMVTGVCGIAVRLYLIASIGFDDPETGVQFRKLFPFMFLIDEVWALSPLMLSFRWRLGLTIICVCLLAYAPIAARNLIRSSYPSRRPGLSSTSGLK